jgi:TPR repeat protein
MKDEKMPRLRKEMLLMGVCLLALAGQANADSLSDAKRALDAGDFATAAKLYMPLAQQGNADAQFHLGALYDEGEGVPENDVEALTWYRMAADQGHEAAQTVLGAMYSVGQGVTQDFKEAVRWDRLAAEQGSATGQFNLAWLYKMGDGVPRDDVRAHMWFNIATGSVNEKQRDSVAKSRDQIASLMTATQIAEAQERAQQCTANRFKGC